MMTRILAAAMLVLGATVSAFAEPGAGYESPRGREMIRTAFWAAAEQASIIPGLFVNSGGTARGPILFPDGSQAAPSITFANQTDLGFYRIPSNVLSIARGNLELFRFDAGGFVFHTYNIALGNMPGNTFLSSDAANTLALRNGANAQTFNVYGTFTDASNYSRLEVITGGSANTIGGRAAGTGTLLPTVIRGNIAAGTGWSVTTANNLVAESDNAVDIGASGATRPRSIYVGTAFLAPDGTATAPSHSFASATNRGFFNDVANGGVACVFGGAQVCQFDGGAFRSLVGFAMGSATSISWSASTAYAAPDLFLGRDAPNILALKNTTNAQTFRVYGDGTKYAYLTHDGTNASLLTSGAGILTVGTAGASVLQFMTAGANTWQISTTGNYLSAQAAASFGFATGAGGTVTQATSKATTVVLSRPTGEITMNAAALAADTTVSFTLTNTVIAVGDFVLCQHVSAGTQAAYTCTAVAGAGSATVNVRNHTPGSLSEAIVIKFVVIKAATS
jgi:hypothetical protein